MIWGVGTGRCGTRSYVAMTGGTQHPFQGNLSRALEENDVVRIRYILKECRGRSEPIVDMLFSLVIPLIKEIDEDAEFVWVIREPLTCVKSLINHGFVRSPLMITDNPAWSEARKCMSIWLETNKQIQKDLQGSEYEVVLTHTLPVVVGASNKPDPKIKPADMAYLEKHLIPFWESI